MVLFSISDSIDHGFTVFFAWLPHVLGFIAVLLIGWPRLVRAGAALRDRHRWAVCVCDVAGASRLCNWRAVMTPAPGVAESSPVRGVWDGVGLRVTGITPSASASASSDIVLRPGRYRVRARVGRDTIDASADAVAPRTKDDVARRRR